MYIYYKLQNCTEKYLNTITHTLFAVVSVFCEPDCLSPARLSVHVDFPGKNTGVGCRFLLQGIFPNPGIEPTAPVPAGRSFTTEPSGKPPHTVMQSANTTPHAGFS